MGSNADSVLSIGGSKGYDIVANKNTKTLTFRNVNENITINVPEKSGTLALNSDFISSIRRGAIVISPNVSEYGPNECPSGCVLTLVRHKVDTQ
ncbi:MAG: hypothetical protein ACL7BU_14880 [Candidatus Phlomobacter fragariae]